MSHSVGHRCAHAQRRHVHHDVGELEHRLAEALAERPAWDGVFASLQHRERDGEDQAEDHHLQDRAVGNGLGDVLREDVQDGVFRAQLGDGRCIGAGGAAGSCTPTPALLRLIAPRPRKIAIVVTTSKKMMERSPSRPTCLRLECPAMPTTSVAKQQRRNDRLDQPQKDQRQHAQVGGDVREVVTDLRAQQHGDEDPRGQACGASHAVSDASASNATSAGRDRVPHARPRSVHGDQRSNGGNQPRQMRLMRSAMLSCREWVHEHSPQHVLQLHSAIGLFVAILHDHRRVQRQAPLGGFALGDRARARHHHRALRNAQRLALRWRDRSRPSRCRTAESSASGSRRLPAPLAFPPAFLRRCRSCRPPARRPQ